jgi:hypothetical protein
LGADKSLAFPIFLFAAQLKAFFLHWLKKLKQRSHKCVELRAEYVRSGADKSLALSIFLFAAQPKEFFLYGLKKLEQRSHKCVELRGGM